MGRCSVFAGLAVGCLLVEPVAALSNGTNYTFFCGFSCGTSVSTGCYKGGCIPESGCNTTASAVLHDLEVCSEFLMSKPACDSKTLECFDAPNFQLAYDRNNDLKRTYDIADWDGLAVIIAPDAAAFIPGGTQIALGQQAVVAAIADLRTKGKLLTITPTVGQVVTVGGVIHATGTMAAGVNSYIRWVQDPATKAWYLGSLIVAAPKVMEAAVAQSVTAATSGGDAIFDAIKSRDEFLSKTYNAKDYDSLLAIYDKDAALIPRDGSKGMTKEVAEAYFKTMPWGNQAKLYPTVVTEAKDGKMVHEVGYSDSTHGGYYAVWVWGADYNVWRVQVQCFFAFPRDPEDGIEVVV